MCFFLYFILKNVEISRSVLKSEMKQAIYLNSQFLQSLDNVDKRRIEEINRMMKLTIKATLTNKLKKCANFFGQ